MSVDPEVLLRRADWIRGLALHLARNAADADDLAQDTLVAALEGGPTGGAPLGRWMTAVARNLAAGGRRASARRRAREARAARNEADAAPDPGDALERLEAHRRLVEAVRDLDSPYCEALLMRYFDGLPPRQIARRTGVPVRTVHTRLHRGLVLLRAALEREGERPLAAWLPLLLSPPPLAASHAAPGAAGPAVTLLGGLFVNTKLQILVGTAACCGLFLVGRARLLPAEAAVTAPAAAASPASALVAPQPEALARTPAAGGSPRTATDVPARAVPEPAAAPAALTTVAGRALDLGGLPVAGLLVGYVPFRPGDDLGPEVPAESVLARATTGGAGDFELSVQALAEEVPAGRVVPLDPTWTAVLEPFVARFGYGDAQQNLLVVGPTIRLAGRVLDEAGAGVGAAEVTLEVPASLRTGLGLSLDGSRQTTWQARTEADGAFELRAAGSAEARLHTRAGGLLPDVRAAPQRSDAWLEIVLKTPLRDEEQLIGTVIDAAGLPVEGARLALGFQHARSGPDGRFVLALPDGDQDATLAALAEGYLPALLERVGDDNRAPDAWPDPLVLQLGGPPLAIGGRVLDSTGRPLQGVEVQLLSPTEFGPVEVPGRTDLSMQAFVEDLLSGREGEAVTTGADGSFLVQGLFDKAYALRVVDRRRVVAEDFGPLRAGTSGHDLAMSPRRVLPRLAGRVLGLAGQPLEGVSVQALATTGGPPSPRELGHFVSGALGHAADDGSFELREVSADVTHLSFSGQSIGFGHRFAIPPGADPEQLEFRIPARCRFQVELGPAGHAAQHFQLFDAEGHALTLIQAHGDFAYTTEHGLLVEGRSEVLSAPETAALLVVQLAGGETLERPVRLLPGEVTLLGD